MIQNRIKITIISVLALLLAGCQDFFVPEQDLVIREDNLPTDEIEYRSLSLGLYALQQDLVEQLVVLGELRGDLVKVADDADPDLIEISNFNPSASNKYASPLNFYKLIAASNKLIRILEINHPEVASDSSGLSNYDYMYGEAICMRSWAYFNAARIYNEIPYIPETLTEISEVEDFLATRDTYVDDDYINYDPNGFDNDTISQVIEYTDRGFLNADAICRKCIDDILTKVRVVGVDYAFDNNDASWEVTIWNEFAMNTLLGKMYMYIGDYEKAMEHFNVLLKYVDAESNNVRYGLDDKFQNNQWNSIFTGIDPYEHIFTLWFGKTTKTFQRNPLQSLFSNLTPNSFALRPTKKAVELWETTWYDQEIHYDNEKPEESFTEEPGIPGDYYRGFGESYMYYQNGEAFTDSSVAYMLNLKLNDKWNELADYMTDVDTVVYKYSIGKTAFDHDANFIIYRAAAVHLYAAEIYSSWKSYHGGNIAKPFMIRAEDYIYNGDYQGDTRQLGVRGRIGQSSRIGKTVESDIVYQFDPYTNEIVGHDVISTTEDKLLYLEDVILDEMGRELAFEGERFYDLMRIAKRRNARGLNGTEMFAETIASKYPSSKQEEIKQILMDEKNWYLPFQLSN